MYGSTAGMRYGRLTREEILRLPGQQSSHLSRRGTMVDDSDIINFSGRDRILRQTELPQAQSAKPSAASVVAPLQYGNFNNIQLSVGLLSSRVLTIPPGNARRIYLMLINTHPLQNMFVTFQIAATALLGLPILNTFGFVEYNIVVPQDDVHLIANGAATTGVLIFSNKPITETQ